MEQTISNMDELEEFLRVHYHRLTFEQYSKLIRSTLDVIVLDKPEKVNEALEQIAEFWDKFGSLTLNTEKPFFLMKNQ